MPMSQNDSDRGRFQAIAFNRKNISPRLPRWFTTRPNVFSLPRPISVSVASRAFTGEDGHADNRGVTSRVGLSRQHTN